MGHFRFRRKVGPFNLSKTGISLTAGVPGAHLNVPLLTTGRKRRSMVTLGMPGTGLSYRQELPPARRRRRVTQAQPQVQLPPQVAAVLEPHSLIVIGFVVMVILWFLTGHHGG